MKDLYIVQPYKVGSETGKSLAIIIPAELVKEYKIGISTILALSPDNSRKKITIETIARISDRFEKMVPAAPTLLHSRFLLNLPFRTLRFCSHDVV